jgi:hypothetical protein
MKTRIYLQKVIWITFLVALFALPWMLSSCSTISKPQGEDPYQDVPHNRREVEGYPTPAPLPTATPTPEVLT